ncbi:MAG: diphosphomevalonate decarboxylase [Prolixibacteraceae bacterium]|jgi:diphosphomevalonate decarboxylase|nr:diphosphomevalonate decarboxylase [Prolixibacteraceae bacterium]
MRTEEITGRKIVQLDEKSIKIGWSAPSNIALIKYWGKRANQLPDNGSMSITLENSSTTTYLFIRKKEKSDGEIGMKYYFHGTLNQKFGKKIDLLLSHLVTEMPFLYDYKLAFHSENNFPHGAGIASSASSMAAAALCLVTLEQIVTKRKRSKTEFFRRASVIARQGSGSAARSIYGGIVTWGTVASLEGTSDQYATPFPLHELSRLKQARDIILIVNAKEKQVSSSLGHAMMAAHPYREGRKNQATNNLSELIKAISEDNYHLVAKIAENEALSLHALLMTSSSGTILLQPNTLQIIEEIKKFRESTGLDLFFTIDAGPNVHLIYFEDQREMVLQFVKEKLIRYCENEHWIDDKIGLGPKLLTPELEF